MNPALLNSMERTGETLAVRTNPAKRRNSIQANLVSAVILIAFGIYAWSQHSVILILINSVLCIAALPVSLFSLWMESRAGRRSIPDIEIDASSLRFQLTTAELVVTRPGEIAQLILMPSLFGQTLVVKLADERAFSKNLPMSDRCYLFLSKVYCGHAIGLTPNLGPDDYREFAQALDRTFPNIVSTRQVGQNPTLISRLLGNKQHEAVLPVHVPPPLTRS